MLRVRNSACYSFLAVNNNKSLHQPSIWLYRVMAGGGFIDMSGDSIAESSAHGYSGSHTPHVDCCI